MFVYAYKPGKATVALRDWREGTARTCHGPVFGGSGQTHGTCQKQLEPRSAACPARHPVRRQLNFSLVNSERLALKSAATDANGWMLSWHFCAGMLHVASTTLSPPPTSALLCHGLSLAPLLPFQNTSVCADGQYLTTSGFKLTHISGEGLPS